MDNKNLKCFVSSASLPSSQPKSAQWHCRQLKAHINRNKDVFQSTITEIINFVLNRSTQFCLWNAFYFWLDFSCLLCFHFCCDLVFNSLETKFSFVHTSLEKWDFLKALSVNPTVSIHANMSLTSDSGWMDIFYIYCLHFLLIKVLSKKGQKVSVSETWLERMNSTKIGQFNIRKVKN